MAQLRAERTNELTVENTNIFLTFVCFPYILGKRAQKSKQARIKGRKHCDQEYQIC